MTTTLVVQKGHCYRTTGSTGTTGEQDFATRVADECVRLLNGRGDWTVRAILADASPGSYAGSAFVAVHCDGSNNADARGASVGYQNSAGQALAQEFKAAYHARGWPGFRADNYTEALHYYYGVAEAIAQGNTRAMIAECGFLTNPDDRALLTAADGAERVARSIGDALGIPHEQQEEDMPGGPYAVAIAPSRMADEDTPEGVAVQDGLEVVETVVGLPIQGGAAGVSKVWAVISAGSHDMELPFCHWRVANGDGTTRIVTFLPDGHVIPARGYSTGADSQAPPGAVSLILCSYSVGGGSVMVESR